jgi:ParB family transcriptional regulator, chromosome partitioning protein
MASSADNTTCRCVSSDSAARWLPMSEIDDQDPTFRITTRASFDDLSVSIDCIGLIHPPILKESSSGLIVVSGFRRIAACRALGWNRMPACVLASNCSLADAVRCAIADNTLQRSLNLVEISRCVNLLAGIVCNDAELLSWATCLQLPRSLDALRKIQPLCRLPESIQKSVLAETMSLAMALELAELDEDMGSAFARLFDNLRISLNKQREILLLIREIALREDVPLKRVLGDNALAGILNDPDLDRSQQARMIRDYLRRRRYPNIAEAERRFAARVKELNLGERLKLIPPKDFEGTDFIFELRFANLSELENRLKQLAAITGRGSLKEILE